MSIAMLRSGLPSAPPHEFLGVRAVTEAIQVRLPGSLKRSDEDIARAVANVLDWNVLVPHDRVKVHVQDGAVTLSGEVDWGYQKYAAEKVVRY